MKKYTIAAFVVLLSVVATQNASAQSGVHYPGSFWTTNGTVSPVEKGNVVSMNHVEQGVAKKGVELFVQSTLQTDSKGYDWNRRVIGGVGVRFTQSIGNGMVRIGASYLTERRFVHPQTINGLALTVDAWFGWGQRPSTNQPAPVSPLPRQ